MTGLILMAVSTLGVAAVGSLGYEDFGCVTVSLSGAVPAVGSRPVSPGTS